MKFPKFQLHRKGKKGSTSKSVCGLDVGTHGIKWVQLQRSEKDVLKNVKVTPIRGGASREEVVSAIRDVALEASAKKLAIRASVSGQSVIARYIHFPKMAREEIISHVAFEADKYIPFNVKDVILDCQILEEKKDEGKVHALVVAAKKDTVNRHLSLLHEAGIEIDCLDVDIFSTVNAFEHAVGGQLETTYHAVVDMGEKASNLSILQGTMSLFSRTLPIGGTDFTQAISEKLGLEHDAAEVLKCSGEKTKEELLSYIVTSLDNLQSEIKLSFDYFENQYDKQIERVYLSGGSSNFPGLLESLTTNLGVPTFLWNPFHAISIPSDEMLSQVEKYREALVVSVGLAVRSSA